MEKVIYEFSKHPNSTISAQCSLYTCELHMREIKDSRVSGGEEYDT